MLIQSVRNPVIRHLASLRSSHRRRRAAGTVLVDGVRETARAIDGGCVVDALYLPPAGRLAVGDDDGGGGGGGGGGGIERLGDPDDSDVRRVWQHVQSRSGVTWVSPEAFSKICYGQAADRCVAVVSAPQTSLADLPAPDPAAGPLIVLDGVEKPGNVGAVFRSADALSAAAVVLCDCPTDRFNPAAIRGSLGAVFTVPTVAASRDEVRDHLKRTGWRIAAMRVEAAPVGGRGPGQPSTSLWDQTITGSDAVVLGSEATGLGDRWRSETDCPVAAWQIPMGGRVDSLNVSVTAAIVLAMAQRCRAG